MRQSLAAATSGNSSAAPAQMVGSRRQWVRALHNSDVTFLWAQLYRLVRYHPLVRFSAGAGIQGEVGHDAYSDLTQELFTRLFSKQRFQHYLDAGMTDDEIEFEISQIELSNILSSELSKRHPESYRLSLRISKLLKTSERFRRCDETAAGGSYRRAVSRVYGLRCWPDARTPCPLYEAEQRVQEAVPVRTRDIRHVGRGGDSQVIISNPELETLIVAVLEVIDAPLDVRSLRNIVISRLPVMDMNLIPLGGEDQGHGQPETADGGENPEQSLLRREAAHSAARQVDQFLENLKKNVLGKAKQFDRMLGVLWHCYLSADHITQLEAAARLGVSDTLVSSYRQQIEKQLRALKFSEVGPARLFEMSLRERVRAKLAHPSGGAVGDGARDHSGDLKVRIAARAAANSRATKEASPKRSHAAAQRSVR